MKKVSTAAGKTTKNFRDHKLTIGLDLGDMPKTATYVSAELLSA